MHPPGTQHTYGSGGRNQQHQSWFPLVNVKDFLELLDRYKIGYFPRKRRRFRHSSHPSIPFLDTIRFFHQAEAVSAPIFIKQWLVIEHGLLNPALGTSASYVMRLICLHIEFVFPSTQDFIVLRGHDDLQHPSAYPSAYARPESASRVVPTFTS